MGASSRRNVDEGSARVDVPWCEELCDASLKRLQCGQWTMVKEKVFCAGGLDSGHFVSKLTVGSNQKGFQIWGSSVRCHMFSVEDRKGGETFPKERPIKDKNQFQDVILVVVSGNQD